MLQRTKSYHTKLAEYFISKPLRFDEGEMEKPNARKCSEQIWQLTNAEMWHDVFITLSDIYYIEVKASISNIAEILKEYQNVLELHSIQYSYEEIKTINEYHSFISYYADILQDIPSLTFQEAMNEPDFTAPSVKAREYYLSKEEKRPWIEDSDKRSLLNNRINFQIKDSRILCCCLINDSNYIALGDDNGSLSLFDFNYGKEIYKINVFKSGITAICYNKKNKTLLCGSFDGKISIIDAFKGLLIDEVYYQNSKINSLLLMPDCSNIISLLLNGKVCLWGIQEHSISFLEMIYINSSPISCATCILHGTGLAIGTADGKLVIIHKNENWELKFEKWIHFSSLTACVSIDDESLLWTGGQDGNINLFKIESDFSLSLIHNTKLELEINNILPIQNDRYILIISYKNILKFQLDKKEISYFQLNEETTQVLYLDKINQILIIDINSKISRLNLEVCENIRDKNKYFANLSFIKGGNILCWGEIKVFESDNLNRNYGTSISLISKQDLKDYKSTIIKNLYGNPYGIESELNILLLPLEDKNGYFNLAIFDLFSLKQIGILNTNQFRIKSIFIYDVLKIVLVLNDYDNLEAWSLTTLRKLWSLDVYIDKFYLKNIFITNRICMYKSHNGWNAVDIENGVQLKNTEFAPKLEIFSYEKLIYNDEMTKDQKVLYKSSAGKIYKYLIGKNNTVFIIKNNGELINLDLKGNILLNINDVSSTITPIIEDDNIVYINNLNWLCVYNVVQNKIIMRKRLEQEVICLEYNKQDYSVAIIINGPQIKLFHLNLSPCMN